MSENRPIKPANNLVWAILSTVFCCLPFGIAAIVQASKVDSLWNEEKYDEACAAAKSAGNWSIAAAVSALIVWIIYFLVVGISVFNYMY